MPVWDAGLVVQALRRVWRVLQGLGRIEGLGFSFCSVSRGGWRVEGLGRVWSPGFRVGWEDAFFFFGFGFWA